MLTNILLFALIVCGVTQTVAVSKLFEPVRDFFPHAKPGEHVTFSTFAGSMLRCPMCLGWWIGAGIALVGCRMWLSPEQAAILTPWSVQSAIFAAIIAVCAGAVGSAIAWAWHVVLASLGALRL